MQKDQLRKIYLEKRKSLKKGELVARKQAITDHFLKLFQSMSEIPQYFHVYLPIVKNKEFDTWPIIHHLWKHYTDVKIVASVTDFETKIMHNFLLEPTTTLVTNQWGIAEPQGSDQVEAPLIDWVLVPLLCFDDQGYRVGYGGGYYDRFLQNCRSDIKKTGVSFFPPVQNIVDINEFDIPLNDCITPARVYSF